MMVCLTETLSEQPPHKNADSLLGVQLSINQSITLIEGGIQEICVVKHDPEVALERDIPFLIMFGLDNITSGKSYDLFQMPQK